MANYTDFTYSAVNPGSYNTGSAPYTVGGGQAGGESGMLGELYGRRPGTVYNPDPYSSLANIAPWLPESNALAGGALNRQLSGQVDTNYLRNMAANLGITTGIGAGGPTKSGFVDNSMLVNGMLYRDMLQNQGLNNYSRLIPSMSGTQTLSPALMLENAWWNATNRAAPNPGAVGAMNMGSEFLGGMLGGLI